MKNIKKLLLFLTVLTTSASVKATPLTITIQDYCASAVADGDSRYKTVPEKVKTAPHFINLKRDFPGANEQFIYCLYLKTH